MEQAIRNKLRNVVTQCRKLLEEAVSHELQGRFGIYASLKKDEVIIEDEVRMTNLSDEERAYRKDLIDHYEHIKALGYKAKDALAQLIREIAFTHLNRLCAYKMMEERDVYVGGQKFREAVSRGANSNGVKFFLADHPDDERLFNTGHQDIAYRHFLDWLGSLLSEEIGILFNPNDPANRLYPPQRVLDDVLGLINDEELAGIWSQDETIGWVYQYFTPKELRDQARKESAAPRNSYELAFRNQFFTPRYVVEFLIDNTLGRTWYEMRKGDTKLKDQCRYIVHRPDEIFLTEGQQPPKDTGENHADLTQEELLKQPVYIPHWPKKDPRELKILDPACGSGHFLLYCFDLLLMIYEEAYGDSDLGPALQADYRTLEELRKAVPGLILKHNLHGIDIDLRATQIAALALWLRCQRAYQEMGLKRDRPKITRSNIVCAEPMPGEQELLQEFIAELRPKVLGQLVQAIFDKMTLANEAGSLLKIEDEITDAVEAARKQWLTRPKEEQLALFPQEKQLKAEQMSLFDVSGITEEQFWDEAAARVTDTLQDYARHAANGKGLARRLFADDIVHGFAFIDICRKRFDVVVMNPPFGDASIPSKAYIEEVYGDTKGDVYKTFVECFQDRLVPSGLLGIISSRTGFFLGQSTDWRKRILLRLYRPLLLADLGYGELDAMVETAAYVLRSISEEEDRQLTFQILPNLYTIPTDKQGTFSIPKYQNHRGGLKRHQATQELKRLRDDGYITLLLGHYAHFKINHDTMQKAEPPAPRSYPSFTCFRILAEEHKDITLHDILQAPNDPRRFTVSPQSFLEIPNAPFAYWVSDPIRRLFTALPPFESKGQTVKQGLATADDFRFVRAWWEVPINALCPPAAHPLKHDGPYCVLGGYRWFPFAKGGEYSPYYADLHLVVNWEQDGEEIRNFDKAFIRNESFYFHRGLTWPRRSTSGFGIRVLPAGCIFADKGPAILVEEGKELATLGLLFSQAYQQLIEVSLAAGEETQSGTASRSYEVGLLQNLPWPKLKDRDIAALSQTVRKLVNGVHMKDIWQETTHSFLRPVATGGTSLKDCALNRQRQIEKLFCDLIDIAAENEERVDRILKLCSTQGDLLSADARVLRKHLDHALPSNFADMYCQDIYNTIRDELDEGGGNRQIAVKSYYLSRHLEVLAQTLRVSPKRIAEEASKLQLLPFGTLRDVAEGAVSYAMGCILGRWDVRCATGEALKQELKDPFAPLPCCSPGMLQGSDGLPATRTPEGYPIQIDWDGILVDDPDHPDDIVRRLREVLEVIWTDRADAIEKEACEMLGVNELRDYFRKPNKGGFWDDHVSRYSRSRRKAPIYWLLQSSKKDYALWIYYHRLDKDILFKALLNYVEPKIRLEESRLGSLRSQRQASGETDKGSKKLDKEIELQDDLLSELRDFEDKLRWATNLHLEPDLNDGAVLNIAPLHELVPWKEAKNYWEELLAGKYEWSSIGKQLRDKGLVK